MLIDIENYKKNNYLLRDYLNGNFGGIPKLEEFGTDLWLEKKNKQQKSEITIKKAKKIHENYQKSEEKINNSINCTNFYIILKKFKKVFNKYEIE